MGMMRRAKAHSVFLITFILFVAVASPIHLVKASWVEKLDTITLESWIPIFALYDPPGNQSYAKFNMTTVFYSAAILFDDELSQVKKSVADWQLISHEQILITSRYSRSSLIIAYHCKIVLKVYSYIFGSRVLYRFVPMALSVYGDGTFSTFSFDSLSNLGMYATNLEGVMGKYASHISLDAGGIIEEKMKLMFTSKTVAHLGFEIEYDGMQFRIPTVQVLHFFRSSIFNNTQFELTFHYEDNSSELDIYRYSNAPYLFESGQLICAGSVWFN